MLGSTAEDFFSPSLEMFSVRMGLPPRFAGVTLLALGNGAADVSATVSAIVQNPERGYEMSLGALTGAGMFVGTVVAGMVIVKSEGVKCRGALVRDIIMLMVTVTVVFLFFEEGVMGHAAIRTFILLYLTFVAVVLAADVYHRKIVLPRIRAIDAENAAAARAESESRAAGEILPTLPPMPMIAESGSGPIDDTVREVELTTPPVVPAEPMTRQSTPHPSTQSLPAHQSRRKSTRGFGDRFMIAMSNYEKDEGKANLKKSFSGWGSRWNITAQSADRTQRLRGADGILSAGSKGGEEVDGAEAETPESAYTVLLDEVDHICGIDGQRNNSPNLRALTFREQIVRGIGEFFGNFADLIKDIFENEENKGVDKFLLICELPFTILRKVRLLFNIYTGQLYSSACLHGIVAKPNTPLPHPSQSPNVS